MKSPKVSIVMPVHNAEDTLIETLESIESQSLSDFEVLSIDDQSTDRTRQILEDWALRDERFRVVSGEQRGLIPSLNLGLKIASAPLVARMDADDVMLPRRLELQCHRFSEDPSLGVVSCGVESFGEQALGEGYQYYDAWLNGLISHDDMWRSRFIESPVAHPSAMVRRDLFDEAGGYRDKGWPEDYDLWLRLFERGVRFAKVPQVLLHWRDHPQRTSRIDSSYSAMAFLKCKVSHLLSGPLRDVSMVRIWGAGHWGGKLGRLLLDAGRRIECFIDIDARKIGRLRHGVPIVEPTMLKPNQDSIVLACVGRRGARELICDQLDEAGFSWGSDYWPLA